MAKAEPRPMEDPESARERAVRSAAITRAVVVDRGAIAQLPRVLDEIGHASACRIVADTNTMAAAGDRAAAALTSAGIAIEEPIVVSESPRLKPRVETAREVARHLATTGALPIAVGSGVINDLTKYAAELTQLPYISVATAASMDGYAASGAALLDGGFKRTLACKAPVAIVADLDVIAKAPPRMAAWGYGDLAGKVVAGADWILADALGEENACARAIRPRPRSSFGLAERARGSRRARYPRAARARRRLADIRLRDAGASQLPTRERQRASTRACVGDGAPECQRRAGRSRRVRRSRHGRDACAVRVAARAGRARRSRYERHRAHRRRSDDRSGGRVKLPRACARAECENGDGREARANRASRGAPSLARRHMAGAAARIANSIVSAATMQQWLRRCGAVAQPADIGLSPQKLAADIRRARLIRRRYTILDCLEDLGLLDRAIAAVCGDERTAVAPSSPSA
jgi:glycerol-1-phosphate dehydrogenase [NAD(P)+]